MLRPGVISRPRIKSDMTFLSCDALSRVANAIANRYDLPPVLGDTLYDRCYNKEVISQPLMLVNQHGTLWLDRYYGAYHLSTGEFHYFYITATHIAEEMIGWREAARARNMPCRMPPQVRAKLLHALRQMKESGHSVWISCHEFPVAA